MELVQKQSTVQIASQAIIDFIKEGDIKPGEKMPSETVMSKRLGVSRATLREVYRQLEIMGYIKLEAGRGAFVAETQNSVVEEGAVLGTEDSTGGIKVIGNYSVVKA